MSHCGYIAGRLEDDLKIGSDYLNSEQYRTCGGINFKSRLSERFYKKYLIESKKSDDKKAYYAILHCAWACDDAEDIENSIHSRQLAIKLAEKILKTTKPSVMSVWDEKNMNFIRKPDKRFINNMLVMKSDLLRRIGEFDQLINEYENLTLEDELLNKIIKFEVKKAYEKDNKCYTLEELHK